MTDEALLARLGLRRRHRPPRLPHDRYLGSTCHFVAVTQSRRGLLEQTGVMGEVAALMRSAASECEIDLLAFAVMPDHVHILARGRSVDSDGLRFMRLFKQLTAYRFSQQHGGILWQQGFFDRILRQSDSVDDVATYIRNNPREAGLQPHEAVLGGVMID